MREIRRDGPPKTNTVRLKAPAGTRHRTTALRGFGRTNARNPSRRPPQDQHGRRRPISQQITLETARAHFLFGTTSIIFCMVWSCDSDTVMTFLKLCFLSGCFLVRMCCLNGLRRRSLPVAVALNRLVAALTLLALMCLAFSFLSALVMLIIGAALHAVAAARGRAAGSTKPCAQPKSAQTRSRRRRSMTVLRRDL